MRGGLAAALMWLAAGPAAAEAWVVEDGLSSLEFAFVINGVEATGRFPAFVGSGRFDPAAPEDSALSLEIAVAEVDVGPAVADAFARSDDWFAAEAHPTALFRLDRVAALEGGRWRAEGVLEMRGVAAPVSAELTLELGADQARAVGETVVERGRFGVGQGPSAALVTVSEEIRVRFDLVARAAPEDGG